MAKSLEELIEQYNSKCKILGVKPLEISIEKSDIVAIGRDPNATKIVVPMFVTKIGFQAFYDYKNLEEVVLPAGLISIDSYAFSGCEKLIEINITDKLSYIGYGAFQHCGFSHLKLPDTITYIGKKAFNNCINIEEIKIPYKISKIEEHTFSNCIKLKKVLLPKGLKHIENSAFYHCYELDALEILGELNYIKSSAYSKSYYSKKPLLIIDNCAFYRCKINVIKTENCSLKFDNELFYHYLWK